MKIGVKWLVSGFVGLMLIARQNGFWFSVVAGSIANAFLVKVLKRIFKEKRPQGSSKDDPGMPSSHAHMLSYFSTVCTLTSETHEFPLLCWFGTILVCAERVQRGIHSPVQCLVGVVTGGLGGYYWLFSPAHKYIFELDETLLKNNEYLPYVTVLGVAVSIGLLGKVGRMLSGKL